ncbi:MAG: peptidoglycan recognition family protein [Chthoniobacteraceae bacterium]
MRRLTIPIALGLLLAVLPASLHALTDDEKKKLFLKAREEMQTVPADESPTPTPHPKPKPAKHASPKPTPDDEETPHHREKTEPTPTPHRTPAEKIHEDRSQDEESTPRPKARPTPVEEESTPEPTPKPTPRPSPCPIPRENPAPTAPITISKQGLSGEEAFQEPAPEPKHSMFWGWFHKESYKYLTPAVRDAIDRAHVRRNRWKYIVVHNSGTRQGNARIFDYYHKHVRKMPNGLAYHFVIGNGSSTRDGQIEIGGRWVKQLDGGHVHSDYLNSIALGICLVGDFNRDKPSQAQLDALDELIRYLRKRCGKVNGQWPIVVPHRQINPRPTDCPGDRFPYSWLNRFK